jgi:hypothetical protein
MIILRNKIYTSTENIKNDKINPQAWMEGSNISSTIAGNYNPLSNSGKDQGSNSIPIGPSTQGLRQMGRVGNTLEKTMSDTPMGVNYVSSIQTKPKKKKSWIARMLRKGSKPALDTASQALERVPIMSEESKAKQRRKLKAIDFYVDSASKGLDNVAERIYSEERMPVSSADMKKAETDGVVQKRPDGKWGIIAKKKRLWWSAGYDSRESAEAALRAYHAGRH